MIDYLLKFPSKEDAVNFGIETKFIVFDKKGKMRMLLTKLDYAIYIIGPHNEQDWWVLFRDCANTPVPANASQYIIWSSEMKDEEDNPLPRPTEDPNIPNIFWG